MTSRFIERRNGNVYLSRIFVALIYLRSDNVWTA